MDSFLATPGSDARGGDQPSYRYKFANAVYDDASANLSVDGIRVNLEPRPLRLLAELLERVNEVVSKEELTENVWDGRPTVDNVFANAVTKLRKALGEPAASRIVTVPRIGYRLDGPVERTATGRTAPAALNLQPGQAVPFREAYALRQPLGTPAQGHVWLAAHVKLKTQQRVFKFAADSGALRRLKREFTLHRMLQATLGERADIAQVLDSNFNEMPYFLECEYGGEDLLAWSESSVAPLAAMSQAERLALFLQVARAVAAAHSAGVLHKDLKPANVLVSGSPERWQVKLIDFGSGRALDPERLKALGLTALGMTLNHDAGGEAISGTVMYVAPELLTGQAPSTQSDIYSLGILLYQFLVGDLRRPMSTGWQREIDEELLREDLAAATEGKPENRLANVSALVDRLAQLDARADETRQRREQLSALQQVQAERQRARLRRPWQIGIVGSLALGLLAATTLYLRAEAARGEATLQAHRAALVIDFLTKDLLESTEVSRSGDGRVLTAPEILIRASTRATERFRDQPRTEASIHLSLGEQQLRMVNPRTATEEFKRAAALLEPLAEPNDTALLAARYGIARALSKSYRAKEGEQIANETDRRFDQLAPGTRPESLVVARLRARIDVMMALQQDKAAIPLATSLVDRVDRWPEADLRERFTARQLLAELDVRTNQPAKARQILSTLAQPPYSAESVGTVTFALADINIAQTLQAENKFKEAETLLLSTRETLRRALGPNAYLVGRVAYELAAIANVNGDPKLDDYLRETLAAFAASLGEDHPQTRGMALNIALGEVERGDAAAGLKTLDALAPWYKSLTGRTDGIDLGRAHALNRLGRYQEAIERLNNIDADKYEFAVQDVPGQRWTLVAERGVALIGLRRRDEGRAMIRDAIAHMRTVGAPTTMYERYQAALH